MELILGSESVFRKQLMDDAGLACKVLPANIDEKAIRDDDPNILVVKLGLAKNDKVSESFTRLDDVLVITSDQVLATPKKQGWEILEKPLTEDGWPDRLLARQYLLSYASKPFTAFTSLVVNCIRLGHRVSHIDKVQVYLSPFTDEEIEQILSDPMTYKAAGAIATGIPDSIASRIIESHITDIFGDKSGLIGLPMRQLKQTLSVFGYGFSNKAKA